MASTRDVRIVAAVTLACVGAASRARALADDVQKQFPLNTMLNHYWLPVIRACIELRGNHPDRVISLLEQTAPYDLAFPWPEYTESGQMHPPYVRGQAYLA